jgi:hypothetical protein
VDRQDEQGRGRKEEVAPMILIELLDKVEALPPGAHIMLKDAEGNYCEVELIRGGPIGDGDFLIVMEGNVFFRVERRGKFGVGANATSQAIQEQFDGFMRDIYPSPPKEGTDQYEQLRDAFFGGALIGIGEGSELGPELAKYLEAKRMNIEFGGDDKQPKV